MSKKIIITIAVLFVVVIVGGVIFAVNSGFRAGSLPQGHTKESELDTFASHSDTMPMPSPLPPDSQSVEKKIDLSDLQVIDGDISTLELDLNDIESLNTRDVINDLDKQLAEFDI